MNTALKLVSWIALAATILPSLAYYAGRMELGSVQWVMLLATITWFIATPMWMDREVPKPASNAATD